ncbi:MAG TPA: IclR family transcriptional regulator [Kaistia sp.]|nr:IclR family transcriptional regulator [Kaistia sp.]
MSGGKRGRTRTRQDIAVTRTLDRGLALLELLSDLREAGLSQLARGVDITPTTASRLIETLKRRGLVDHDETTGLFSVGMKAFLIGSGVLRARRLDHVALPAMRALAEQTGLPVSLGIRDGGSAVYTEQVDVGIAVQIAARLGRPLPLHATAIGKVLTAWLWDEALARALGAEPLEPFTSHTTVERDDVLRELQSVRNQGWATDDQEYQDGLFCIAVPVRDRSGDVIAGLSVSSVASRMSSPAIKALLDGLLAAAGTVSSGLGWQPTTLPQHIFANDFSD